MLNKEKRKKEIKIAIQGGYGAFHEIASRKLFNTDKIEIVPCDTFEEQFEVLAKGKVDCIVMAIENTLAGSLLSNYKLLRESGLSVCGEIFLKIEHQLVAMTGQCLANIKEVYSHPIAIQQCLSFLKPLRKKGVKIIDSIDTALSAKMIRDNQLIGVAAICSNIAAEMYQLNIIAANIETNPRNFTRFLLISEESRVQRFINISGQPINKASLCFSLPHLKGRLSQILSIFAKYKNNLTKIQSLPIEGVEWEYHFYVDLIFEEYNYYKQSLEAIKPLTNELQIIGEYPHGKR